MRLLMLHAVSPGSGANVHVRELARALAGQGAEVHVHAAGLRSPAWNGRRRRVRVPQRAKDLVYLARNPRCRRAAVTAARQWSPDALYVRGAPYMAFGAQVARQLRLPLFYEVNAPFPEEHVRFHGGGFAALGRRIEHDQRSQARAIFVVSQELRRRLLADGVPAEKVLVVRNGVDLARFDPTPRPEDGRVRLGFVGSLQPWHGISELLEMAEIVLPRAPQAYLEIAGDGPLAGWLGARLRRSAAASQICWHGGLAVDDVPAFLQRMDIVLAPYPRLDGFYFSPLKVFEYLAAGRAVVASRIGQIQEVVEDGATGALVPPGDVGALASTCLLLIEQPLLRRRLGDGARAAATRCTWEAGARAVVERIERCLGERTP